MEMRIQKGLPGRGIMPAVENDRRTFIGVVYPQNIDHMGHMNVQYYASMFDQATWAFLSGFGITSDYMRKNHKGMAAVNQVTNYFLELFAGDVVEISTRTLNVENRKIRFVHTMRRIPQNQVIAATELVGVHMDTGAHRACPFPDEIMHRLSRSITDSVSI